MLIFPALAAIIASVGWATGIVLAQTPARMLGAFEFTRIQLIACGAILGVACTVLGYWPTISWDYAPAFAASTLFGIVLGNLAMIECLRRGGPRRTELLLSLKAPIVAIMAYFWLSEVPSATDLIGGVISLAGVLLAIFFGGNPSSEGDNVRGSLWVVIGLGLIATSFQGFGFLVMKPAMLAGTQPIAASAIRLLGAALVISVMSLWPIAAFRPKTEMSPVLLGRTILPGFIGYGVSSTLLLYAFANFDAGIAAVLGSLSPVIILPILWFKDGKRPRLLAFVGALLAVVGTAIIVIL